MTKVGRNDPCPCGSGKKYKKCCLAREKKGRGKERKLGSVVASALEWLEAERPAVVEHNATSFFGSLDREGVEALGALSSNLRSILNQNFADWLLAEAAVEGEGEERQRVLDEVLESSGLLVDADTRHELEELGRRSLSLYEVEEAVSGEGVWVRDLLAPEDSPRWVVERTASRDLSRWDAFGARILATADGTWIFSGAIYLVPRPRVSELRAELEAGLAELEAGSAEERSVRSVIIIDFWLGVLTRTKTMPELVDGGSGEPLEFVTDHYEVGDWEALGAALAACDDVEGDRERGWARLEPGDGEARRTLLNLSPGEGDRLELFGRSRKLADEGRAWFTGVAGDAVRFLTRETIDPRAEIMAGNRRERSDEDHDVVPMTRELTQQVFEHFYRNWADKPLPVLNDQTPRQAIRTPEGLRDVVELLKTYEHGEAWNAEKENREPASLRFLWEELGLDRERILG